MGVPNDYKKINWLDHVAQLGRRSWKILIKLKWLLYKYHFHDYKHFKNFGTALFLFLPKKTQTKQIRPKYIEDRVIVV